MSRIFEKTKMILYALKILKIKYPLFKSLQARKLVGMIKNILYLSQETLCKCIKFVKLLSKVFILMNVLSKYDLEN